MMTDLRTAAQAIGGILDGAEPGFGSVCTDTRAMASGALFVAIQGERFDGHDFVRAAGAAGAAAALVNAASGLTAAAAGIPLIAVENTRLALGRLAAWWRRRFAIPMIAVTGSNGKTTVKEMTAAALRAHFGEAGVLATAGNLNNDIGLPLTVLRLTPSHRVAVVEVGMNHPGETAYLASIAQPSIAIVNNAQREHQEFMKTVADVAREHGAVLGHLPADGIAVLNADDAHADDWRAVAAPRRIRDFAIERPAALTARWQNAGEALALEITAPEGAARTRLTAAGAHNVRNALAALAASTAAGTPLDAAASGLAAFRPVTGRLAPRRARHGATVIDDTYNANPDSVIAAIDVLAACPGIRVLVLGDMGEVGERGPAFHAEVGRHAREQGIDHLFAIGDATRETVAAFGRGGAHFESVDALVDTLGPRVASGMTVLVKGSRFMRMERVVERLTEAPAPCC